MMVTLFRAKKEHPTLKRGILDLEVAFRNCLQETPIIFFEREKQKMKVGLILA
jgi:hypothetical protein